jgi:hypothetical protein
VELTERARSLLTIQVRDCDRLIPNRDAQVDREELMRAHIPRAAAHNGRQPHPVRGYGSMPQSSQNQVLGRARSSQMTPLQQTGSPEIGLCSTMLHWARRSFESLRTNFLPADVPPDPRKSPDTSIAGRVRLRESWYCLNTSIVQTPTLKSTSLDVEEEVDEVAAHASSSAATR